MREKIKTLGSSRYGPQVQEDDMATASFRMLEYANIMKVIEEYQTNPLCLACGHALKRHGEFGCSTCRCGLDGLAAVIDFLLAEWLDQFNSPVAGSMPQTGYPKGG